MAAPLIAVVDDDDTFLDLMRDVLTDEGYRVVVERLSERVVALLAREQPELLILDLRMERAGSGMAMLVTLRQGGATATLPILICSADHWFLDEHAPDIATLGATILPKPFDLSALSTCVAQMVGCNLRRRSGQR